MIIVTCYDLDRWFPSEAMPACCRECHDWRHTLNHFRRGLTETDQELIICCERLDWARQNEARIRRAAAGVEDP